MITYDVTVLVRNTDLEDDIGGYYRDFFDIVGWDVEEQGGPYGGYMFRISKEDVGNGVVMTNNEDEGIMLMLHLSLIK